jgi:hypothetical protein
MIEAAAPGYRWEIEVLGDGSIDVEVFQSGGQIFDGSKISELIDCYADSGRPVGTFPAPAVNSNGA